MATVGLLVLSAVIIGFGIWMLAGQGRSAGLIPIAFGLFNVEWRYSPTNGVARLCSTFLVTIPARLKKARVAAVVTVVVAVILAGIAMSYS